MAKNTITLITDDIDGSENAKSYTFAFGSDHFEIDLSDENYQKLAESLAPFIEAGTKVAAPKGARLSSGSSGGSAVKTSREEMQKIRGWAKSQGMTINDRGRIAQTIVDAYKQAH